MTLFLGSCASFIAADASLSASNSWSAADTLITNFSFLPNVSFIAGDARGRQHSFDKGSMTLQKVLPLASSSKFPAALAIADVVQNGHLSFDTRVADVFAWWNATDHRSNVTLRHLLTMTSGLVCADVANCGVPCLNPVSPAAPLFQPEACARQIYDKGPWTSAPGAVWSYHSLHLQIAGAMAAAVTNLTLHELLDRHLISKLGLKNTFWLPPKVPNPHLAALGFSTGDDYEIILQSVLNYDGWSEAIITEMEADAYRTYPGLRPGNDVADIGLGFYGHYSMCTYFECVNQPWSERCERNGVHADPGAFGFWPLINRPKKYYMMLALAIEVDVPPWVMKLFNLDESTAAALPAECVSPLRFPLQAPVEAAMGKPVDPNASALGNLTFPIGFICEHSTAKAVGF